MKLISDEEIQAIRNMHNDAFYTAREFNADKGIAKTQRKADQEAHDKEVREIFEEIENKAHHTDLVDTIRINLDWLDYQALKQKYIGRLE